MDVDAEHVNRGLRPRAYWEFGVLFSQSGVTAAVETTQLNATILAKDVINAAGGILGRPIELVIYDPASNPKQFHALAERLLIHDRVRIIFGCYMSSTRKAVVPLVEAHRGLLLYPTLYEGLNTQRIASTQVLHQTKTLFLLPDICSSSTASACCS